MFTGLNDSVALINGAAGGMGKQSALRLGKEGCKIFAVDISESRLQEMKNELAEFNINQITTYVCNSANENEVNAAVEKCINIYGTINILFNVAGIYTNCLLKNMSTQKWQETLDINLNSIFFFCRAVIPSMIHEKRGKIINVSSQAGIQGSIFHSHYAASKAAIIGLSRSLARELAAYNISVNCLAPGIIKTPLTAHYTPEQIEYFMNQIPMNRFGEVDDVAKVVEFLASNGSDYLTGQVFNITGGWLMLS